MLACKPETGQPEAGDDFSTMGRQVTARGGDVLRQFLQVQVWETAFRNGMGMRVD
jgi:hypothetical protein